MNSVNSISGKQIGRRIGNSGAKEQILTAARELFAQKGLDQTTMRQIAAQADVDPALIVHYFKNKQQLFVESMSGVILDKELVMFEKVFTDDDISTTGIRLAEAFVDFISDDTTRMLLLGIIRSAATDETAVNMLQAATQKTLLGELKKHIPEPDSDLKATLIGSQLLGIIMARYIGRVEPLASATSEDIVRYLGPRLQTYFGQ